MATAAAPLASEEQSVLVVPSLVVTAPEAIPLRAMPSSTSPKDQASSVPEDDVHGNDATTKEDVLDRPEAMPGNKR